MFLIQIRISHRPFGIISLNEASYKGMKMIEYTINEYVALTGFSIRKVNYLIKKGQINSIKRYGRRIILMKEPIYKTNSNDIGFIILKLKESVDKLLLEVENLKERINNIENNNERMNDGNRNR